MHLLTSSPSLDTVFPVLLGDLFVMITTAVLTKFPLLQQ